MTEVNLSAWKECFETFPDGHLLQTGEWGALKSAFGWEAIRLVMKDSLAVQILFRRLPFSWTIAYLPKPAIPGEQLVDNEQFWAEVDPVCKKRRAIFLKIEPDLWEDQRAMFNFQPAVQSPHNIQPPRTIVVNLRGSEEQILARMKQKTRYNIRLAEKKGISVRAWDDLPAYHEMAQIAGGRDGFGVHSLEYYRRAYDLFHPAGLAELLVAEYDGKPLAALMVFVRGRRAWYVYGASNDEERNRMPTYLLQWEAMRWVRAKGAEEYDLWGVPDCDETTLEKNFMERSDGLWGVYRFKRGFGGEVRRAAQALDRVYNPLLYWFYKKYISRT